MDITIKTSAKDAVIILLAAILLVMGLMRLQDWRAEQAIWRIDQTQTVFNQIYFPRDVARALKDLGWQVRIQPSEPAQNPIEGRDK